MAAVAAIPLPGMLMSRRQTSGCSRLAASTAESASGSLGADAGSLRSAPTPTHHGAGSGVIVGQEDADRCGHGTATSTRVPSDGAELSSRMPPTDSALSFMLNRPKPLEGDTASGRIRSRRPRRPVGCRRHDAGSRSPSRRAVLRRVRHGLPGGFAADFGHVARNLDVIGEVETDGQVEPVSEVLGRLRDGEARTGAARADSTVMARRASSRARSAASDS